LRFPGVWCYLVISQDVALHYILIFPNVGEGTSMATEPSEEEQHHDDSATQPPVAGELIRSFILILLFPNVGEGTSKVQRR